MSRAGFDRALAVTGVLIVILALGLRLWELDRRGYCHPENYVPGLPVPSWVHDPPRRVDLPSLAKSLLRDAHPPLYYMVMLPWVDAFGISVRSIRLPSALLGAASVLLLWRIALRETSRAAAVVAAALLALHGQEVYWSQTARVYALAIFVCLLATWLLWKVLEDGRRRFRIAYGLAAAAALWTHMYCWPVILCHVVWAALRAIRTGTAPAALGGQFVAAIASMPALAFAVYLYRPIESADPRLEFFEFGYLYWSEALFVGGPPRFEPTAPRLLVPHAAVLAFGLVAIALGLFARPQPAIRTEAPGCPPPTRRFRLALLALGWVVALGVAAAGFRAFRPGDPRFTKEIAIAAAALVLAGSYPVVDSLVRRFGAGCGGKVAALAGRAHRLSPILALAPFGIMVFGSLFEPAFLMRGTMIYVPFLLLVAATGLTPSGRARFLAIPLVGAALAVFAISLPYSYRSEHTLRDYRGLAAELEKRLLPEDLILITNEYSDPPLLYYLRDRYEQFVPAGFEAAVRSRPAGRVWVIRYEDQEMTPELLAATSGLQRADPVLVAGARALQFTR